MDSSFFANYFGEFISEFYCLVRFWTWTQYWLRTNPNLNMSCKTVKYEESAMDSDELAENVKANLMPSIERMMREIIKQEVANLVSEAVRSELRSMTEGFNKIVEENRSLKIRVDNLEMQSRSNNLVIHGLPETSYAEAASTSEDAGGVVLRSPRQDNPIVEA